MPKSGDDLDIWVHEANRSLQIFKPKQSSSTHMIIKLSKIKDKYIIFKSPREKYILTYKGTL